MSDVLISGGRLVDPSQGIDAEMDVLLSGGVVARVGERLAAPKGAEVIAADGLVVAPGFVDLHVHLREPGFEHKETIATGTAAAAAGGFTTVCAMANTKPVVDDAPTASYVVRRIRETARVRVFPIGAVSKGLKGQELAEIGLMKAEGIVAVSDDGKPIAHGNLMRRALEYASMLGLPLVVHEEDPTLVGDGVMNEGWAATRLGLAGWPNVGESSMVARDVELAALTGARLHVAHVSTRGSLKHLASARAAGLAVSSEVTPHHLTLTDEEVARSGYDTRFKMNPPLRSEADRQALVEALVDGTIDCIATDHAPHHADEKALEFADAPFGVTGLETALAVLVDALVVTRLLSIPRLVEVLSTAPARLFGLPYGTLREGAPADIVLFSTARSTHVTADGFLSRSANSPWLGRTLRGRVERTFVEGREVFRRGAGGVPSWSRRRKIEAVETPSGSPPAARPKRIVLVDDSPPYAEAWRQTLSERYGDRITFEAYADPLKAIPVLGPDVDLLLVDLEMPVLDGRKVLAVATARGVTARRIVILSGHDADELHQLFPASSCLAVINKTEPQQQNAFLMILDSIVRK